VKQYHKRFYFYGKTVPELLDKINEFTKQYSVGNIFDVSIMEVLDKQIETDEKKYDNICELDLTTDLTDYEVDLTSHLVISLEVGEHIPKEHMATYLDNVTYHGTQYLITSWAVRGQEGFGHVNCLDNHEIIPEFEKRGFELMEKETEDARSVIEDKAHWFKKTILIFKIK